MIRLFQVHNRKFSLKSFQILAGPLTIIQGGDDLVNNTGLGYTNFRGLRECNGSSYFEVQGEKPVLADFSDTMNQFRMGMAAMTLTSRHMLFCGGWQGITNEDSDKCYGFAWDEGKNKKVLTTFNMYQTRIVGVAATVKNKVE